ncbi:sulfatase [Labilibacter sediminis]|nr:sulfatase [Labilibacter sediminis]
MKKNIMVLGVLCVFALMAKAQQPNVVMIVLDDLNDYLGVMDGHPQAITPHLDQLARNGVLFENAHSNAPVCAPSRSSFMSGIHPVTSQNYGFDKWMQNDVLKNCKTISAFAMENGYQAYQTGKIQHHPHKKDWNEMGVKKYQGPMPFDGKKVAAHPSVPKAFSAVGPLDGTFAPLSDVPDVPASSTAPGYKGWYNHQAKTPFRYVSDDDRDKMTDEKSVDWLSNKIDALQTEENGKPFFIAFGIMNPHTPHVVPKKYFDMYTLDSLKIPVIREGDNDDCHYDEVLVGKGRTHFAALKESYSDLDEGLRAYLQGYLACVSFADDIVGNVMGIIDNSKFKDNTVVILFSDHGYNMGEKDYLFKNSLWEESTRVPLIIRHPDYKQNAGRRVKHPVSLIDVYPTIVDLCNMEGSTLKNANGAELDGYSLKPFIKEPDCKSWDGPDVALTVVYGKKTLKPKDQNYSIRSKEYRYVRYINGSEELYDHRTDSYEWINVAADSEYADVLQQMRSYLKEQVPSIEL